MYHRTHICLITQTDAANFVSNLNRDGSTDRYVLETADGRTRVSARSLLGVLYFISEHNKETYLVNETNDGVIPSGIDQYRI